MESAKLLLNLYGELSDRPHTQVNIDQRNVNIQLTPQALDEWKALINRFDSMMQEEDIIDGEIVSEDKTSTASDVPSEGIGDRGRG